MRKRSWKDTPVSSGPKQGWGGGGVQDALSNLPNSRILGVSPRLSRCYLPTRCHSPPQVSPSIAFTGSTLVSEVQ